LVLVRFLCGFDACRTKSGPKRPNECRDGTSKKGKHVSTDQQADLGRMLIEQAADAVIFADREGTVQLWNQGAKAVFGYDADEILGRSLDVIVPEHLRVAHWTAFHKAIETGRTKHGGEFMTTRSIHKDGRTLYLDLSFALVKDESDQVLGSVAMARDITNRIGAEKETRKRIAELEAQIEALTSQS
jgi:PAS domain S-box-containing protein